MTDGSYKITTNTFNFIADSTLDTINILKLIILTTLVKKICKNKKNNKYYFSVDDDIEENNKLIDKWIDVILKLAPSKNPTILRKSTKKIYSMLRHLCKSLVEEGIVFESKTINIVINGEKKTKFVHLISGLDIIE